MATLILNVQSKLKKALVFGGLRPTYASDNKNGFISSLLETIIGERKFPGFHLYEGNALPDISENCRTAVTQRIDCHDVYWEWQTPIYHGIQISEEITDMLCDEGCERSLKSWFEAVERACAGQNIKGALPTMLGGFLYQGYNETCLKDATTDEYCNDVIDGFTLVQNADEMPLDELCSYCYVQRMAVMQKSSYSVYNENYKRTIEVIKEKCDLSLATEIPPSPIVRNPPPPPICSSGETYTVKKGDTCDSIALEKNVASAALFSANSEVINKCSPLPVGVELCLPSSCGKLHTLQKDEDCIYIEREAKIGWGRLRAYNDWINLSCTNLHSSSEILGNILCLAPQARTYSPTSVGPGATPSPDLSTVYAAKPIPPPIDATIAVDTTRKCGKWYTVTEGDTCASIFASQGVPARLFWAVNPSLSTTDCDSSLEIGTTYCMGPAFSWD